MKEYMKTRITAHVIALGYNFVQTFRRRFLVVYVQLIVYPFQSLFCYSGDNEISGPRFKTTESMHAYYL